MWTAEGRLPKPLSPLPTFCTHCIPWSDRRVVRNRLKAGATKQAEVVVGDSACSTDSAQGCVGSASGIQAGESAVCGLVQRCAHTVVMEMTGGRCYIVQTEEQRKKMKPEDHSYERGSLLQSHPTEAGPQRWGHGQAGLGPRAAGAAGRQPRAWGRRGTGQSSALPA